MRVIRNIKAISAGAMRRPVVRRLGAPLRKSLARALVATDFRTAGSGSDACDLVAPAKNQPVLLIVDASDEQDEALSQVRTFKRHYPSGRVAVIADHCRRSHLISAFRAGANACVTKGMSCDAFLKTLELVMLGQTILPPELLPFLHDERDDGAKQTAVNGACAVPPDRVDDDALRPAKIETDIPPSLETGALPRLSTREKCILRCVIEGCSNKSIARKTAITEATVKVHVKAIFRKIHVNNRTQAAIWAIANSSQIWAATEDVNHDAIGGVSHLVNSVARTNETSVCENWGNGSISAFWSRAASVKRSG